MASITPTTTAFGPGAPYSTTPNVPGTPTYVTNEIFRVTSSNDVLIVTSDQGGPVSVDIPDAYYAADDLATAAAAALNGSTTLTGGTITFAVTYSTTTLTYTFDATSGHTLTYTHTGSDAGATFGFNANHSANRYLYSDDPTEGLNTIEFDFSDSSNSSDVTYCLYDNTRTAYIAANGTTSSTAVWQTYANWNGGGQSGRVVTYGTTTYTAYTFKAAAKNPLGTTTAFSASSTNMFSNIAIDWGTASDELEREVTSGNTKIKLSGVTVSGTAYDVYSAGGYGAIATRFVLQNNYGTASAVTLHFSEDQENYTTAADFYIITSASDGLRLTSDQGGPVTVTFSTATYNSGTSLATAVASALNGSTSLTGGVITFGVTYSTSTYKYTFDATTGHTLALDYWNSDGAYGLGFTDDTTAAQTMVSSESRGLCPRTLPTNSTGIEATVYWDSYTDAGKSEKDTTVTLKVTPYDVSPSGGDAGAYAVSNTFSIDNTPTQLTLANSDGNSWDEDTTPAFISTMASIKGGNAFFFRLVAKDYNDVIVFTKDSSMSVTGWSYQTAGSTYAAVVATGVPAQYADGTNKIKYTVQAADALTAANAQPYNFTITPGEVRDV